MKQTSLLPKPFIKWAGGKSSVLPHILEKLEPLIKNNSDSIINYHEPFVGGGAVFFALYRQNLILKSNSFLSDINEDLINVYECIKTRPEELIQQLREHSEQHNKNYYYKLRQQQQQQCIIQKEFIVERAARFIYLNKTCFNGLYRVNKKGEFNVPIGSCKTGKPKLADETNIREISKILQNTEINTKDFTETKEQIRRGDLIYLDPPYYPANETSFTAYSKDGFGKEEHIKLKEYLQDMEAYWLLSNSDTQFVRNLYRGYFIKSIKTNRMINSDAKNRKVAGKELLISNF